MVSGETDTEPEVAPPVEKPVPVQEVAFAELQESVEDQPSGTTVALAESVALTAVTVTVAEAGAEAPPAPVQVSV